MNATNRRNRKHFSENTAVKTRKRVRNRGIIENVLFPVIVRACTEGNTTSKGTATINFELQHIVTKAVFPTVVFEGVAPYYIDEQINDCILPDDVEDYNLADLVGGGFFVKLNFNKKNDVTYMNIVEVEPLDEPNKKLLQQLLKQEKQTEKLKNRDIHSVEDELEEMYAGVTGISNKKSFNDSEDEEMDLDLDIDEDDDSCLNCDGLGCEFCEEDSY